MSPAEVTEKLGLHRMRDRSWFVHPSCATSGEVRMDPEMWLLLSLAARNADLRLFSTQGLFEGLSWLSANVRTATKA